MHLKVLTLTLAACLSPGALSLAAQSQLPSGIDLGSIDRAAQPCDNFYQYACGTWNKNHPIPPDQSRWSRFGELAENNRTVLRGILEKAAVDRPGRSDTDQKIGDYYSSCMDEKTVEQKGISPIQPELDRIAKMNGKDELPAEIAHLHSIGVPAFFAFTSGQDAKNSSEIIAQALQAGISLPDRDFYLSADAKSVDLRAKYAAHVQKMLELLGHPASRAAAESQAVLQIETALAKASTDRVALRDPNARYHRMPVDSLSKLAPGFDWKNYMKDRDVYVPTLNVGMPEFFKGLNEVIAGATIDDLRTYLTWHVAHTFADSLSSPFVQEDFNYFSKTLNGTQQMLPRWKRCVSFADIQLGEALGKAYVDLTFGKEGKERTLKMVGEIEHEMEKDIESLVWMSPETKKQALVKLHAVANKIGYPEQWRDYSSVKIMRGDLVGNVERASAFDVRRRLAKIGQPVDKMEWGMTPPTVNAYYMPSQNNINFPAGILQPPFYYKGGDEAANYGAVGAVVGHELTHGFDDQGRQYDGQGNLRDWWTASDASAFKERADCIVNEYGNFIATGDLKLNGRLTLGENAADNGGIRLAYMALMDSLAAHTGAVAQTLDGFTPQQRFFLGFAQIWCDDAKEESARVLAKTNPHSPGRYRTNGVLQNMPEFQQAFGCKAGQPMVSPNACRVW